MTQSMLSIRCTKETIERQLQGNIKKDINVSRMNELGALAYEAIHTGLFGAGPFEVTICAEADSFAITVMKG